MSPADTTPLHNRALPHVLDALLFVVAFFWTVLTLYNVPASGVADPELSDAGVALWFVAMLAWGTIFFRRRLPIITLCAGLLLAILGLEYLLLLFGAYHAALAWRPPARTWLGWITFAMVVLFWLRETFTRYGDGLVLTEDATPNTTIIVSSAIAVV